MKVGLLIITHNNIGEQLLKTASIMLGNNPLNTVNMNIDTDCDLEHSMQKAKSSITELNQGDGVLVLTDMYGSTPSNIANSLAEDGNVVVIAGINLPMLIRAMNYPRLNLKQLADKALSGGHDGILICK
jgi:PTS system ascorbate-specific IIA component